MPTTDGNSPAQTGNNPKRKRTDGFSLSGLEVENVNDTPKTKKSVEITNTKPKNTTRSHCPPIFSFNVYIKGLVEDLEAKTPKITFKIKNVNKSRSGLVGRLIRRKARVRVPDQTSKRNTKSISSAISSQQINKIAMKSFS